LILKRKEVLLVPNKHEGSIPFTRSIDNQGFSQQFSKSAVSLRKPGLFEMSCSENTIRGRFANPIRIQEGG
jgi:hypothetical protein